MEILTREIFFFAKGGIVVKILSSPLHIVAEALPTDLCHLELTHLWMDIANSEGLNENLLPGKPCFYMPILSMLIRYRFALYPWLHTEWTKHSHLQKKTPQKKTRKQVT